MTQLKKNFLKLVVLNHSAHGKEVNGKTNQGAAWYYPTPKPEAKNITNYVAFWKGVKTAKF